MLPSPPQLTSFPCPSQRADDLLGLAEGLSVPLPDSPFKGIESFRYSDRLIFFARDAETERLLRYVTIYRGVLFYGDSGVGKSSLINSGFIPAALQENFVPHRLRVNPRPDEEIIVERISETAGENSSYLPSIFAVDDHSAPRIVLSINDLNTKLRPFRTSKLEERLADKLQTPQDPLSLYLREQLTDETRELLEKYDKTDFPSEPLQRAILREMEQLIRRESIFEEGRFAHVKLSDEIRALAQSSLKSGEHRILNQLLLEESYPPHLPPLDGHPLLIFDQFEEFVTLFEVAPSGKELKKTLEVQKTILSTIVELLNDSSLRIKLLFIFREDYLAKLTTLFERRPELVDQYVRLTPVQVEKLDEIIRGPFEKFPEKFGDGFSPELTAELKTAITERSESGTINLTEVQIVCLRLWQSPDPVRLFKQEGIQGILEGYLADALNHFPEPLRDPAVALLSRLVTSSSVTSAGTRNVVSEDDLIQRVEDEEAIPRDILEDALRHLETDAKLILRERRFETYFYQIVSEFLVPWITRQKVERRLLLQQRRKAEDKYLRHLTAAEPRARKVAVIWFAFLALFWLGVLQPVSSSAFPVYKYIKSQMSAIDDRIKRADEVIQLLQTAIAAATPPVRKDSSNSAKEDRTLAIEETISKLLKEGTRLNSPAVKPDDRPPRRGNRDLRRASRAAISELKNQVGRNQQESDKLVSTLSKQKKEVENHIKWLMKIKGNFQEVKTPFFWVILSKGEVASLFIAWNVLLLGLILYLSITRARMMSLCVKAVQLFNSSLNLAKSRNNPLNETSPWLPSLTNLGVKNFPADNIRDALGWRLTRPPGWLTTASLICLMLIQLRVAWLGVELMKLATESSRLWYLLAVSICLALGSFTYYAARWYRLDPFQRYQRAEV